jgi:spore germination protein YaaH
VEQERVLLAWTPGRDPDGRVGDYVVTRNGRELGRPRDTRFWAVRLLPDTQYVFQVRTRDRVGRLSRDAAEITVRTAAPAPASGPFRLYVLATDRTARQRFRDHVRSATWAYPTFFDLAPDGRLDGRLDRPLARFARAQGVRVLARVHTSSFATLETHLVPGDARGALVTRLAQVASDPDLDGISIDFEPGMPRTGIGDLTRQQRWDRMRAAFTAFVEDLAERLHQEGRLLSVNVAVTWCERRDPVTALVVYCTDPSHPSAAARPRAYMFDYPRIVAAADELSLLSWGLHWTTSEPGPISDAAWLDAVLATTRELLVRAGAGAFWSRVTLGTQLYGIDWAYRVVRLDVLDPPTARPPAAPRCVDSDPASTARPRRRASTRDGRPVLEVEWICLTRPGRPLLHSEVVHLAAEVGASPQLDASSRERTFAFADPDGVRREVWFPDAATVESRLTQARSWGVQLALWRPGQEDPATWELR